MLGLLRRRDVRGRVFDIQRFSLHDGPGIRTTVFLKGCPLRCLWCHNPESQRGDAQIGYDAARCVDCGSCLPACPLDLHSLTAAGEHRYDRGGCVACGQCVPACPQAALELLGRKMTVDEALAEVVRDRAFYESSGGGMTISGGEPLTQPDFVVALLEGARAEGIATAVETSGQVAWKVFERVRPLVDLFLFDIKETDPVRHREFCGADPALIHDNLRRLHDAGARILVRLPLVPGYNARDDHFDGVAALLAGLPQVEGVEVMPYHRLGTGKRERLGLASEPEDLVPPSDETVANWLAALRARGLRVVNAAG